MRNIRAHFQKFRAISKKINKKNRRSHKNIPNNEKYIKLELLRCFAEMLHLSLNLLIPATVALSCVIYAIANFLIALRLLLHFS